MELRLSRFDFEKAKQDYFYVVLDTPSVKDGQVHPEEVIKVSVDNKSTGSYASVTNTNTINMDAFWALVNSVVIL